MKDRVWVIQYRSDDGTWVTLLETARICRSSCIEGFNADQRRLGRMDWDGRHTEYSRYRCVRATMEVDE